MHLLLWITCCAVYLTIALGIQGVLESVETGHLPGERFERALEALVSGTVLTGLLILLRKRVRGDSQMFRSPGHWLLLSMAPNMLANAPANLLALNLRDMPVVDSVLQFRWGTHDLLSAALSIAAVIVVTGRRWKLCFATLSAGFAFRAMGETLPLLLPSDRPTGSFLPALLDLGDLIGLIASILLLVVGVADLAERRHRDWLHWAGFATFMMPFGIAIFRDVGR
jgi:hypothetical protein